MSNQPHLKLAVTHLNVSTKTKLTVDKVALALKKGTTIDPTISPTEGALISSMFMELTPGNILGCAREAGASIQDVYKLYRETLKENLPRVKNWEKSTEYFL